MGELRIRCERMDTFGDLAELEEELKELIERKDPLVVRLPSKPGRHPKRRGLGAGSVMSGWQRWRSSSNSLSERPHAIEATRMEAHIQGS